METSVEHRVVARVRELVATAEPPAGMPVKIVAIDGHGGAGKSTLAELLARELSAEIVHTDDFASWEEPVDWWPRLVTGVLDPVAAGAQSLSYPRSAWWPGHRPEPVVDQPVTPILLLEGVTATRTEFRPFLTLKIWVETPVETCLQRGVERDRDQGTPEEVEALWRDWIAGEDEYIARDDPRGAADLIVDGTKEL